MIYSPNFARLADTVFLTEGATGVDIGGNGYTPTLSNMATAQGRHTQSLDFNGSNASVGYNNVVIPVGAKTMEVICRFDSVNDETLVDNGGGNSLQNGSLLIIESGLFKFYSAKGVNLDFRFIAIGGTSLQTATWYYLAAVWDGTTGANGAKLYVNGLQDGQITADSTESATATNNLNLGRYYSSGSYFGYLDGRIQSVRIGNTAASAAFILAESKRMGF